MNREIKFRAWAFASNTMFYPDTDLGGELNNGSLTVIPNTILMQYTGLKDKNSKEIYEGDILNLQHRTVGCGKNTKYKNFNCLVEYYKAGFIVSWPKDYGAYRFRDGDIFSKSEIIGNIYENPELLK